MGSINGLTPVQRTRLDEEHYECERVQVFLLDVWTRGSPRRLRGSV